MKFRAYLLTAFFTLLAVSPLLSQEREQELTPRERLMPLARKVNESLDQEDYEAALEFHEQYEAQKAAIREAGEEVSNSLHMSQTKVTALLALERYPEAIEAGNQIVKESPTWSEAYEARAQILLKCGKYPEAIEDCSKAIECQIEEGYSHWQTQVGNLLELRGQVHQKAGNAEAAKNDELAGQTFGMLGNWDFESQEYDAEERKEIIQKLSAIISTVPKLGDPYRIRAQYHRTDGELEKAKADLQMAIARSPVIRNAYFELAEILSEQKEFDEALRISNLALEKAGEDDTEVRFALASRGKVFLAKGEWENAVEDLTGSLTGGAELELLDRAKAYSELKRFEKALEDVDAYADRIIELNNPWQFPNRETLDQDLADALLIKAEILAASGDAELSAKVHEKGAKLAKKAAAQEEYFEGVELYRKEEFQLALAAFSRAVELWPENQKIQTDRILTAMEAGEPGIAKEASKRLIEKWPEDAAIQILRGDTLAPENLEAALPHYLKANELEPGDLGVLRNIYYAYLNLNDAESANDYGQRIREQLLKNDLPISIARVRTRWAAELSDRNEYAIAKMELDEAISLDPGLAKAFFDRGKVFIELEQFESAASDLSVVLELGAQDSDVRFLLGYARMNSGQDHLALANFSYLINHDTEEWPAYYFNRGVVNKSLGNLEDARLDFRKSAELAPDDIDTWIELAEVARDLESYPESLKALDRVAELDPENVSVYFFESGVHELQQNWSEAEKSLDRYLEMNDASVDAYTNRAIYRLRQDKLEEALADCDKAIALDSEALLPLENRIVILKKLNRPEELARSEKRLADLKSKPETTDDEATE